MADRVIVTLIHGTWAKGAEWTRRRSKLRAAIAEAFPGKVEFWPPYCWSGRNTIDARRDAAVRLRNKLVKGTIPAAGTRHFLVAHSHGGNVALYALRDPGVSRRIAGVAVLATPFLIAKKRDLGKKGPELFCLGFLGWGWLAGHLVSRFIWPGSVVTRRSDLRAFSSFLSASGVPFMAFYSKSTVSRPHWGPGPCANTDLSRHSPNKKTRGSLH